MALLVIFAGCDSKSSAPDAATNGDSASSRDAAAGGDGDATSDTRPEGATGDTRPEDAPPPEHRIVATRCAPTAGTADAGTIACTTDADCLVDGGFGGPFCLEGTCQIDQCLIDGDCPAGTACGCSNQLRGLTVRRNSCMPSTCRTDADCAETGLCSPASGGHCGSLSGFHCRTSADTCRTNADCPSQPDGGLVYGSTCDWAPEVGHWACVAIVACGG